MALLLLHVFDYCILVKYYDTFLEKRRQKFKIIFGLYSFISILLGLLVYQAGNLQLNICMTVLIMVLTSLFYREKILFKIITIIGLYGMGIIAEVLTFYILKNVSMEEMGNTAVLICQLIRLCLILLLCIFKTEKNERIPHGTTVIIALILGTGTFGCILMNWNPIRDNSKQILLGTLLIIFVFLIIFFFIFVLLDRFNRVIRCNYEKDLLIQENNLKEEYYKEIDYNNMQLRKIKHNYNNQLLTLSELSENNIEAAKECIQGILKEIHNMEGEIYTSNNALNSICKVKFEKAKREKIELDYELALPSNLNINYGDMGILYGNLLDNAIEACEFIETDVRKIILNTKLRGESLFISIANTKQGDAQQNKVCLTTKRDKRNHGFGLKSVKEVVEKYGGLMDITQENNWFKVEIVIYGVKEIL